MCINSSYCAWHRKCLALVAISLLFIMEEKLLEAKVMATHSSTLAWKMPWTGEPGRLQSMGSLRVGHD